MLLIMILNSCSLLHCVFITGIPALIVGITVGVAHDGYGNTNKWVN